MRHVIVFLLFAVSVLSQTSETLTNQIVAKMVQAGVPMEVIVRTINASPSVNFSLMSSDLIALGEAGVPEEVIKAMAGRLYNRPVPSQPTAPGQPVAAQTATPPESSQPASPEAAPSQPSPPRVVPAQERLPSMASLADYALPSGGIELGAFGGVNFIQDSGQGAKPTVGGEFAVGLSRNFALYAEGVWNRILGFDFEGAEANANLYDISGGVQISFPNSTRIVPYFRVGPTLVHATANAKLGGVTLLSESANEFAVNFGGGTKIHVSERFGVMADVRAFKGPDVVWFGRMTGGVFCQFK